MRCRTVPRAHHLALAVPHAEAPAPRSDGLVWVQDLSSWSWTHPVIPRPGRSFLAPHRPRGVRHQRLVPKFCTHHGPLAFRLTPAPKSLYAQLRMFWRCPELRIQSRIAVLGPFGPLCMFSPQAPAG